MDDKGEGGSKISKMATSDKNESTVLLVHVYLGHPGSKFGEIWVLSDSKNRIISQKNYFSYH